MTLDIVLERPVMVETWRVIGRVAWAEKRDEIALVLQRAREARGTDAGDIARHLLFSHSSRRIVADRLLNIGLAYKLLRKEGAHFALTDEGVKALDAGEVFVPEYGAWTVWASEDALLPHPVLGVEPWVEALGAHRESREEEGRSFESLPSWIHEAGGSDIEPWISEDRRAARIDRLEECAESATVNMSLTLVWSVHESRLRLRGEKDGKKIDSELPAPTVNAEKIWRILLEGEGIAERWSRKTSTLTVPFRQTCERERETMLRDMEFEAPSVPDYGGFNPLKVRGVAIAAGSDGDACEWSLWRLRARIGDYATKARYADWCMQARKPFARSSHPQLPSREELAAIEWDPKHGRPCSRAWHLVAAEDWGL